MPLKKGTSNKTVSSNIRELHGGKTYARTRAKLGKAKANKQAVAIALDKKRRSGRRSREARHESERGRRR
jgi:hypothetical protein